MQVFDLIGSFQRLGCCPAVKSAS